MKKRASVMLLTVFLTLLFGCDTPTPIEANRPAMQVTIISSASLPKNFEDGLLFEYEQAKVEPESLLTELLDADIPVVQAWLPLDNRCMDAIGPRFTIELRQNDALVSKFDFKQGSGRLECATTLKHYFFAK